MAKVSIVVSVYNKGPWLDKCLSSLLAQTFSDIEFVLIDNASTDNSRDIINNYMKQDKRIRLVEIAENIGPGGGNATGIDHVTSEYFGIVDADDYVDPDYVEILYNEIKNSNADVVMCANDYVLSNGTCRVNDRPGAKRIFFNKEEMPRLLPQILDHFSSEYLGYCLTEVGVEWAKLYKTSFIKDNNINYERNASIWSDWLFNFRVLKVADSLVYTEDAVYHNFVASYNSVTRSSSYDRKRLDEILFVLARFEEECADVIDSCQYLYSAKMGFFLKVMVHLLGLYSRIRRISLNWKEEISYLDQIRDAGLRFGIFQYAKDNNLPDLSNKIKLRLLLMEKRIYFGEIAKMLLAYAKGNTK